jgi:hypothetical protein
VSDRSDVDDVRSAALKKTRALGGSRTTLERRNQTYCQREMAEMVDAHGLQTNHSRVVDEGDDFCLALMDFSKKLRDGGKVAEIDMKRFDGLISRCCCQFFCRSLAEFQVSA